MMVVLVGVRWNLSALLNLQVPNAKGVGHCFKYLQVISFYACLFYSSAHVVTILFVWLDFVVLYIF